MRRALAEHQRVTAEAAATFATPEAARRAAAERGAEVTAENLAVLAKLAERSDPRVISERAAAQHLAMLEEQARALAPVISECNWVVLDFGAPLLLTSDEPVAHVGPKVAEPGDAHGVRYSAQLVFSIDPRRALMMVRPDMPLLPGRMRAEADAAVIVNQHVAFNAYRSIVRQPGTDPLASDVAEKSAGGVLVRKPRRAPAQHIREGAGECAREGCARRGVGVPPQGDRGGGRPSWSADLRGAQQQRGSDPFRSVPTTLCCWARRRRSSSRVERV